VCDRIAVMYLGRIVEEGETGTLFRAPAHPYTRALLNAMPASHPTQKRSRIPLQGEVPTPIDPPSGCRFRTRCPFAIDRCGQLEPALLPLDGDHRAACTRLAEINGSLQSARH